MHKEDLALNNLRWLICQKENKKKKNNKQTKNKQPNKFFFYFQ